MTETEFIQRADAVLESVGESLDASDLDCDWEIADGILTMDFENGKVILNRHVPNRELWLASSVTGGAHFRLDEGVWRDTRSQAHLRETLSKAVSALSGVGFAAPSL